MTQEGEYVDLFLYGTEKENSVLSEPIELFFQEVELAVKIAPNSIWGLKTALDLSKYLFNRFVTITQIKNEIIGFLRNNCEHARFFNYSVSVQTIQGPENKDLIYIEVSVENETTSETFKQKFLLGQ